MRPLFYCQAKRYCSFWTRFWRVTRGLNVAHYIHLCCRPEHDGPHECYACKKTWPNAGAGR